jgi:2-keto-3-deoxy-L-rhamnonate aldolase RhmA
MNKKTRLLGKGTWISIGCPVITEVASNYPFDWLLFDMEHGYLTETSLLSNMQAVSNKEIKQIVRVPSFNPALIARVLDWGATGIMMPHVSIPGQAKACVEAMQYPPLGSRGYSGQARSFTYGLNTPKDIQKMNPPHLLVQIEDYEGVMNAAAIAQVEGVDVLFVGPSDLKLDLCTRPLGTSLEFTKALQIVTNAAKVSQKQAGILIKDIKDIPIYLNLGFTCLAIDSDLGILRNGYQSMVAILKNI